MNYWTIFITGLFAGGLTCLAMQGGLLVSSAPVSVTAFLIARLIGYTFLGLLLGSLGTVVTFSLSARIIFQTIISIFILGTALNLLQIHPIFRYFIITPPKFIARWLRSESKVPRFFSPVVLGLLTVFIPCGATQAMMSYAISTGSAVLGASVMFVFILGTTPLFALLGFISQKATQKTSLLFNRLAAVLLIFLAVYSLDGAVALTGKPYTLANFWQTVKCQISFCPQTNSPVTTSGDIIFTPDGYVTNPPNLVIKSGTQVKLRLINNDAGGCIQAFTIPSLNYQQVVSPGSSTDFVFTAPAAPGPLPFMCGMGMYRGTIKVI